MRAKEVGHLPGAQVGRDVPGMHAGQVAAGEMIPCDLSKHPGLAIEIVNEVEGRVHPFAEGPGYGKTAAPSKLGQTFGPIPKEVIQVNMGVDESNLFHHTFLSSGSGPFLLSGLE